MGDPVEIDNDHNGADLRSTYDALRSRCAVAHEDGRWVILRHAEVVAAATDPGGSSMKLTTATGRVTVTLRAMSKPRQYRLVVFPTRKASMARTPVWKVRGR